MHDVNFTKYHMQDSKSSARGQVNNYSAGAEKSTAAAAAVLRSERE